MKEIIVYNPLVQSRPFCLIQSNGDRKTYKFDELKLKGVAYTNAAKRAILTWKAAEVNTKETLDIEDKVIF